MAELTLRIGQILVGDPAKGEDIRVIRQGQKVEDPGDYVERFGVEAFVESWDEWITEHPEDAPPPPPQSEVGFGAEAQTFVSSDEGNQILAMDEDEVKTFVKTQSIEMIVNAVNGNPKAASYVLDMEEETSGGDVRKGLAQRLGPLADQYDPDADVNEPPVEDEEPEE
jgi:hypothetical protein